MIQPENNGGGVRPADDIVMEMARRPAPLQDVVYETLGVVDFRRLQLGDTVLRLLLETARFRSRAASYRDFKVGAGALCVNDYHEHGRALGFNVKLDDTDYVNIHAEDLVCAKASDAGSTKISVLAVIGEPQIDHASGKLTDTLHPCGRCRDRLSASPLLDENTLFVMARPDFTVLQFASLTALKAVHESGDDPGITSFRFSETPKIFAPLEPRDEWRPNMQPLKLWEAQEIDARDYDESIGLFLIARYNGLYRQA